MSEPNESLIYYWADGTWCFAYEYGMEYAYKSDDFTRLDASQCQSESEIDAMVDGLLSYAPGWSPSYPSN